MRKRVKKSRVIIVWLDIGVKARPEYRPTLDLPDWRELRFAACRKRYISCYRYARAPLKGVQKMPKKIVDTILPTTMVGSYPRPTWYKQQLLGRDIQVAFKESSYEETYHDAVAAVVREQEEAG